MLYDYENASLGNAKKLILEYQKSRDRRIFEDILGIFDSYLVYLLKKFKKQYKILKLEDDQELYHISIIGFHDGVLKLHSDWRENKILLWLGSYVKMHLLQEFKYRYREVPLETIQVFPTDEKSNPRKTKFESLQKFDKLVDMLNIKSILNEKFLSKKELKLIELKYYQGLTINEIAKLWKRSSAAIFKQHRKLCLKIKRQLMVER